MPELVCSRKPRLVPLSTLIFVPSIAPLLVIAPLSIVPAKVAFCEASNLSACTVLVYTLNSALFEELFSPA